MSDAFEILLTAPPGLERVLLGEAEDRGFAPAQAVPGGVRFDGGWPDVWRANLTLRGASRVLARIASFRALHLAQLDKRARRVPWGEILRPDVAVKVEATCTRSRIYHAGAASQRISRAIADALGAPVTAPATAPVTAPVTTDAPLRVLARIDDDLCTLSIDTTGAPLHQRGTKQAVGKAPMRETLAALFLRDAGYRGTEPLVDPMCGSGTFPLEAAGLAAGRLPGLHRGFAFERLATFDPAIWARLRPDDTPPCGPHFVWGHDRDQGAIASARANADRAGLGAAIEFGCQPISALRPPADTPGLVIANPPYGARIGNKNALRALYFSFGDTLQRHFSGWRVAFVTSEPMLARATGLPLAPPGPPIPHGSLKIRLYRSEPLP